MDRRGFANAAQMNDYMIRKWNEKVRWNDEVVILGDLSWGKAEETMELLKVLNGHLCLIEGNHDRFGKMKGYSTERFKWVRPYTELHDDGRKVILSHYPILCYNGQYHFDDSGNPKTYMLYGHVHDTDDQRIIEECEMIVKSRTRTKRDGTTYQMPCQMINCFCMYSDYTPLTLDEWIVCDRERRERRSI